ncbi:hypothetical protein PhCBS80983_g05165 [Powellomyces hirtus]|uniref:Alcohol dehydrogenase-like C-terminal domain-containing protein n=1 Tax=Powellomyces hirtus TaxID=109895 RepID=A0A507DXM8_9FUNG|nr:hypothetical protein PhCBS80983_g05165 [Powellomyces hirtus]
MTEAMVHQDLTVTLVQSPIPVPSASWCLHPRTLRAVGDDVSRFKVGDRVAALHELFKRDGSFAEFALVGAFAVKLAVLSNIHPIIAVAIKGIPFVETLIDKTKGDVIIDYRDCDEAVVSALRKAQAAAGSPIRYAFDATTDHNSCINISQVLDHATGALSLVLPGDYPEIPASVNWAFPELKTGLAKGWFSDHPRKYVEGGFAGIEAALGNLKAGNVHGCKYVVKIAEEDSKAFR